MKKIASMMFALTVAVFAATALTACDDDDNNAVDGNTFTISNS